MATDSLPGYDNWLTYDPAINEDPEKPEPPSFEDRADEAYQRLKDGEL